MRNCESCGCQGNVTEVVYDTTQQEQHQPTAVTVAVTSSIEELVSSDDKPP